MITDPYRLAHNWIAAAMREQAEAEAFWREWKAEALANETLTDAEKHEAVLGEVRRLDRRISGKIHVIEGGQP